jgi:hypothetical protein
MKTPWVIRRAISRLNGYWMMCATASKGTHYPLAIQQIQIDLDDGVKANYQKFGLALKKIPGLEAKEED